VDNDNKRRWLRTLFGYGHQEAEIADPLHAECVQEHALKSASEFEDSAESPPLRDSQNAA
jgi:hypothetical protein